MILLSSRNTRSDAHSTEANVEVSWAIVVSGVVI